MPTKDVEKRPFLEKRPTFEFDIEKFEELLGVSVKNKDISRWQDIELSFTHWLMGEEDKGY